MKANTEIWLFHPRGEQTSIEKLRHTLKEACNKLEWKLVQRPTQTHRAPNGRPLLMVTTEDAANLYRRMHRVRVGIFLVKEAFVRADPSIEPNVGPGCIPLDRYVRYKALLFRGNIEQLTINHQSYFKTIENWCKSCHCDGENDPRCLPFHVFETKEDHVDLDTQEGRIYFDATFGSGSRRTDARKLLWTRASALHGGDVLCVAGKELVKGFHWDVNNERSEFRICTANEVWKVQRGGYLNIYPDAYVRQGHGARRVYPK